MTAQARIWIAGFEIGGPADVVAVAAQSERLGYAGLWLGDHLVAPVDFTTPHPYQDPAAAPVVTAQRELNHLWVTIGAVLAATSTLHVGTGILQVPLRHPIDSARAALSAWRLGGDRFHFGVGAGWMPEEFAALGVPFTARGRLFDESLGAITDLLAGGPVSRGGPAHAFEGVQLCEQASPVPFVFGGLSPAAARRAALLGAGWYGPRTTLENCLAMREQIDDLRHQAGRAASPFRYFVKVDSADRPDDLAPYLDAGFADLVLPWRAIHPAEAPASQQAKLVSLAGAAARLGLRP